MTKIIIIHGLGGHPKENWFSWLKQELEKLNYVVEVPQLPSPYQPQLKEWLSTLEKLKITPEDILIGHSLGTPTTLKFLETHKARAAYLIGGFCSLLDERFNPSIKNFVENGFEWKKIKNNCQKFIIFHGDDDPFVPLRKGEEVAKNLGVKVTVIKNGGHLNEEAKYFKFQQLLEKIKEEFKREKQSREKSS